MVFTVETGDEVLCKWARAILAWRTFISIKGRGRSCQIRRRAADVLAIPGA
jgi:hypothetical protein